MTTGRINQVATNRFWIPALSKSRSTGTRFASVCGISIASLHQFRNCPVPQLRPSACAPRWKPTRGAAGKTGSAAPAPWNSIPARNSAEVCYRVRVTANRRLQNNHWSIQLQYKSTGHPEPDSLALGVKAKKEKRIGRPANQAFAWCHPEAGKTCNRRGCTKLEERKKKKKEKIWIIWIQIKYFFFHLSSASWI